MGCASSHSVRNTQQIVATLQKTIDQMKSKVEAIDQMKTQIERQSAAVHDIETRHQALSKQFMAQVSEHVSLCADFMTFIDIAREHEQAPKEIMERVEYLESKIASGIKNELSKVQEQLHNLESSALLDESTPQTSVLAIESELQNVQKKVLELEEQLFSAEIYDAENTNISGDGAEDESEGQVETDDRSDSNSSELALESLFTRLSPSLNRSSSSNQDYDVVGVLDFALLEPEDAFEAEISSITARVHRHAQQMKPPVCYPPGFEEPKSNIAAFPTAKSALTKGKARIENAQLHLASRSSMQATTNFASISKSQVLFVEKNENRMQDNGSDSTESSEL